MPALAGEPTRSVSGQTLTSTDLPPIRLKFDRKFKYVGTQSFTLYGVAQAEQHFFVDADDQGRIRRLYWIQFEGYLPSNDHSYKYPITQQTDLAGLTFIADASALDLKTRRVRAGSDTEHAWTFLTDKGYRIASDYALSQRLVHLIGDDRRNELMIIYVEPSKVLEDNSERWPAVSADLLKRASKGFSISH